MNSAQNAIIYNFLFYFSRRWQCLQSGSSPGIIKDLLSDVSRKFASDSQLVCSNLALRLSFDEEFVETLPVSAITSFLKVHVENTLFLFFVSFAPKNWSMTLLDYCHVVSIGGKGEVIECRLALLLPLLTLTLGTLHRRCTMTIDRIHIELLILEHNVWLWSFVIGLSLRQINGRQIARLLRSHMGVERERILSGRSHRLGTSRRLHVWGVICLLHPILLVEQAGLRSHAVIRG